MQYRKLGNTEMDVSIIGLEQIETTVHACIDRGYQYNGYFYASRERAQRYRQSPKKAKGQNDYSRSFAHKRGECIACGSCEDRCPFSVKVINNMEMATKFFEI